MTDSPLLEGVSPQECQAMRACLGVYEQYFRPGDIVYDLGGGRNMLGVLTNGAAVIERVDGKGERTILEHLEPGGVFGEMMMFRSAVDNSVVVRCAAHMVVSDSFLYGFAQLGKVGVKFNHIVLEQRLLHCYKGIFSLNDVTRIAQRIVSVVNMQFEIAEVVCLKASFCLCHNCNC